MSPCDDQVFIFEIIQTLCMSFSVHVLTVNDPDGSTVLLQIFGCEKMLQSSNFNAVLISCNLTLAIVADTRKISVHLCCTR